MEQSQYKNVPPYLWCVGITADGEYRFIPPTTRDKATSYIGAHGGGIYTHAGYLIFASDKNWWNWLSRGYAEKCQKAKEKGAKYNPPHIELSEIDCIFSDEALQWLKNNEELLKEKGGNLYGNIPRIKS